MTVIRRAEAKDIPWLLAQLQNFAQFFGTALSLFPRDAEKARLFVTWLIVDHIVFLAEDKDQCRIGFIGGTLAGHPYNADVRTLSELFWWVAEPHRGSSAGARLLDTWVGYGRLNADLVFMSKLAHSPIDERALLKRGFAEHERTYLYDVRATKPDQPFPSDGMPVELTPAMAVA